MSASVFSEKVLSLTKDLVLITGSFNVGSSGAVTGTQGTGVTSVTRLGAGVYRIKLAQAYNRLLGIDGQVTQSVTGGAVNDGSLNPTTLYQIVTVGTSNFVSSGAIENKVGEAFVATGAGGAGTGTVKALAAAQTQSIQLCQTIETSVQYITIACVDDAGAVGEAENGSRLFFNILLRKSSLKQVGE